MADDLPDVQKFVLHVEFHVDRGKRLRPNEVSQWLVLALNSLRPPGVSGARVIARPTLGAVTSATEV